MPFALLGTGITLHFVFFCFFFACGSGKDRHGTKKKANMHEAEQPVGRLPLTFQENDH